MRSVSSPGSARWHDLCPQIVKHARGADAMLVGAFILLAPGGITHYAADVMTKPLARARTRTLFSEPIRICLG